MDLIDRCAQAACLALNPDSDWEGAPETVRETYRKLASAVLAACDTPASPSKQSDQGEPHA